eukprot:Nitzschia sp. Nitz4//scaffold134_size62860//53454//54416//NITZ4_006337-RA/size62860-processed-gene-0.40-mRNA-1//1//CDS//3329535523//2360//frame0
MASTLIAPTPTSATASNETTKIATRRRPTTRVTTNSRSPQDQLVSFSCGLVAGVVQAGLFNPVDRALYLSVKNQKPFLSWEHFRRPYLGFYQSVGHRALSGGLYFPLENFFLQLFIQDHDCPQALVTLGAGTAAGTVNAIICNPIAAIKYKTWSREVNRGMLVESMSMLRKGGLRPFLNGMSPTILRDLVFGGTYTFLRCQLHSYFDIASADQQIGANVIAAALATVISGPLNLARNVQYATCSRQKADSTMAVMNHFMDQVAERPTLYLKWNVIQNRLRLGWGTARVALGMAFGHYIYDQLLDVYQHTNELMTAPHHRP